MGFFFWLLVLVFLDDLLISFDDTIAIRFDDFSWVLFAFWRFLDMAHLDVTVSY